MKPETFEDWLRDFHLQTLDGNFNKKDLPDMFDYWVADLNIDEWLKYGDLFGRELANKKALESLSRI